MSQQSATLSGKQLPFVDSAKLAEEQLKIMDLGFSEIVRQVAVQCSQRAELMHRMWRASHELYDKLLVEMTSVIDGLRYSAADWKEKCELVRMCPHHAVMDRSSNTIMSIMSLCDDLSNSFKSKWSYKTGDMKRK